jgi:ribosomal protein L32E
MTPEQLERRNAQRLREQQMALRQMYARQHAARARKCLEQWGKWDQPTQDVIRRNVAEQTNKELELFR